MFGPVNIEALLQIKDSHFSPEVFFSLVKNIQAANLKSDDGEKKRIKEFELNINFDCTYSTHGVFG